MKNMEVPVSIKSDNKDVGFGEINNEFSSTEYGQKLVNSVRWDRYKPSDVPNIEWEKLLGVDANNFKHLRLTYGIARQFIKYSDQLSDSLKDEELEDHQLNQKEQEDLLLAAIVHDWAEAVTGDHSYDLKTQKDEETEFEEFKKLTGTIYKDKEELLSRINFVTDTIIKDTDSKLGKMFNIIERVGYLRTGLRSWEKTKETSGDLKVNLEWLTSNVVANQISKLIQYSETYPAVALYLKENRELINDAFNNMPDDAFSRYSPTEIGDKTEQFKTAKEKWVEYCGKQVE